MALAAAHAAAMPTAPFTVRQATAGDSDALYHVCLVTGDSGADGTHLYTDDPHALGTYSTVGGTH